MDYTLHFAILPNGSTQLSAESTAALGLLLSDARAQNKSASIELICAENLDIRLLLRVSPTTSSASPSTSSRIRQFWHRPALPGSESAESGEDATATRFTSQFGKGE